MAEQRKPPVQCGNCGAEIKFEPGQLVGDPAAIRTVIRQRDALMAIANSEIPGISGGPEGPSVQVMKFARNTLESCS